MKFGDLSPWRRGSRMFDPALSARLPVTMAADGPEQLFDRFLRAWDPELQERMPWPQIEVIDGEKEFSVTAELPGLAERDINIAIEGGILSLSGERKSETTDDKRGYSERFYGRFERRIALPSSADEAGARAAFANGVLTVTLPKSDENGRSRKIPIETASH